MGFNWDTSSSAAERGDDLSHHLIGRNVGLSKNTGMEVVKRMPRHRTGTPAVTKTISYKG
jgi:hypothetical protein